jgi:hypothetical protein
MNGFLVVNEKELTVVGISVFAEQSSAPSAPSAVSLDQRSESTAEDAEEDRKGR